MATLGVHSEVGTLHTVMVCRPGRAHERLTPGNRAELLFDDVLWVHEAQKDHYDFVLKMRERGVEVLELHDLLTETLSDPAARTWLLDRRVASNDVGPGMAPLLRAWLGEMPAAKLTNHLIGGVAILDLPRSERASLLRDAFDGADFLIPPVPEHALPARSLVLDLQRRHGQPDVLAGAQAGNAASARRLQVPSAVQRRRLHDLVGRLRRELRRVDARGRRRDANRQRRRAHRHGRAHDAAGRLPGGRPALRAWKRHACDRLPDAEEPRRHAPRHGVHLLRPRSVHVVPGGRRSGALLQREAGRQRRRRGPRRCGPSVRRRAKRRSGSRRCASSKPAATPGKRSASNGTTATTSSRCRQASWSATTATRTPTRCCARPASR